MIGDIFTFGTALINKIFPDKAQAAAANLKLIELQQTGQLKELEEGAKVIIAETQGESWLQRNWRPVTMLVFVSIVANNYILYPYLSLFWSKAPLLPLPQDLWKLLELGIGGYILGRSGEKITKAWKA